MFSKFTSMIHNAVEAVSVSLPESWTEFSFTSISVTWPFIIMSTLEQAL